MPAFPVALTRKLVDRIRDSVRRRTTPSGPLMSIDDVFTRCDFATRDGRTDISRRYLIWAVYKNANGQTSARFLAPISRRLTPRGDHLLYAHCGKDGWDLEAFRADRFLSFEISKFRWTDKGVITSPKAPLEGFS